MKEYILVIDTEASGLPKKWDLPYSTAGNWPYAVQVSWLVYTKEGQLVKQANHYVGDGDFDISATSIEIHGITPAFLATHGEPRQVVLTALSGDIARYDPLIVGHFVELDKHIMGADYYRSGMDNLVGRQPSFCTMIATGHLVRDPRQDYPRLGELYTYLFDEPLQHQHNALVDATATAACFFELLKRGDITDKKIEQQQADIAKAGKDMKKAGWVLAALAIGLLTALIAHWL